MDRMQEPASAVSERRPPSEPASPASFEAFFQAEHERLQRALYLVTGDAQEAEELHAGRVHRGVGAIGGGRSNLPSLLPSMGYSGTDPNGSGGSGVRPGLPSLPRGRARGVGPDPSPDESYSSSRSASCLALLTAKSR